VAIPIQNIYYLLCYAWDRLEARQLVDLGAVPGQRLDNLLGMALSACTARLIRQGLDRGYVVYEEDGRRLRGKLLVADTLTRMLLPQGRAACQTDELSHNVPHNQVLKAALRRLVASAELDTNLRGQLRGHLARFAEVSDLALDLDAFRRVQLHRNIARYGFAMHLCWLIARSFLPERATKTVRFHPFTADEREMGHLFEAFVRNFLKREQDDYQVSAPKVPWAAEAADAGDLAWLPQMRTDVTLTSSSRRIVVETKFYAKQFQSHYDTKKVRSAHLYQLLTYLAQMRATGDTTPAGCLLYARAGTDRRLRYRIDGHDITVASLDLNQPWRQIHKDLLELAAEV
jgi:5-methylcytosine-specific restriction enzyme subunit McrC